MVNPSLLRLLAKDRERELLALSGARRRHRPRRPTIRERLGWALVGFGARLARDSQVEGAYSWRGVQSDARLHPCPPLVRT